MPSDLRYVVAKSVKKEMSVEFPLRDLLVTE